ncbi:MAG: radical SAM protein [Deltaproteobacteria bacterium]|nr:radical SAM protein [Deltaproteobacteria bacterium]
MSPSADEPKEPINLRDWLPGQRVLTNEVLVDQEALALFTLIAHGSEHFTARIHQTTTATIEKALVTLGSIEDSESIERFVQIAEALVSPAADALRPALRTSASARTALRPQTINLYSPLYLSNACTNRCVYCGFRQDNDIPRLTLADAEIEREAAALAQSGVQEVLLLTGEAPAQVGVDYVVRAIEVAKTRFHVVGLEVFPMGVADYARVHEAGASALTLYQETYDPRVYRQVHQAGRKRNFQHRLSAPHRAVEAGFRRIGIGALLGLSDWRFETLALALHARFLRAVAPDLQLSISFPRIRSAEGAMRASRTVDDGALIHMMSALRLLLPDVTLVLSTREAAELRDALAGTLVTKLSAGSKTNPGGYSTGRNPSSRQVSRNGVSANLSASGNADADANGSVSGSASTSGEQFEVHDHRPVSVVAASLLERGFDVRGYQEHNTHG